MILVFGSTGQLGHELVRLATRRHVAVAGLSRADANITDYAAVARALSAHRPFLVVNAAAYTNVDQARK